MKTPIDKIRNGKNDIIQIIVAPHSCDIALCSNCTQLIPFRKDRAFMTPDVFREALRSLKDWPGVRALFGGNPCVSPHFSEYCRIMREEIPDQSRRGLWTNHLMTQEKAQAARDTFWPRGRHNLNVHGSSDAAKLMREYLPGWNVMGENRLSWHSPILMDWKDYGIPPEEWVRLRESCDINQNWSAAIIQRDFDGVPRPGVYFCEVGAALDGVRNVNHSILAEPGWWSWPISRFQGQIQNCCDAGCGVPLKRKGSRDLDFTYDYSPAWADVVEPVVHKRRKLDAKIHDELPIATELTTDYQRIWTK